MFTGVIQISPLISIPVTVGKATSDNAREQSLVEVCTHESGVERISRSEYCKQCHGRPAHKATAVQIDDENYRVLSEDDLAEIDNADGGSTLKLIDVQRASKLPLLYAQGTYYIRHNDNAKTTPDALATSPIRNRNPCSGRGIGRCRIPDTINHSLANFYNYRCGTSGYEYSGQQSDSELCFPDFHADSALFSVNEVAVSCGGNGGNRRKFNLRWLTSLLLPGSKVLEAVSDSPRKMAHI